MVLQRDPVVGWQKQAGARAGNHRRHTAKGMEASTEREADTLKHSVALLACVGGLTLLTCACAFDGFQLEFPHVLEDWCPQRLVQSCEPLLVPCSDSAPRLRCVCGALRARFVFSVLPFDTHLTNAAVL